MKVVDTKIPILFQKIDEIDDRFMRVKIFLMHLGENYNGSYFSKEYVEKAIPTLANTPILGYIVDKGDEEDFSDHREVLVIKENGEITTKYLGQAYGVIPEDNNAQFELRVGDDGVTREYLTCEGLLWKKWDNSIDIINRDTIKSQSMELDEKFEGYWDDETGLFHFTKFKFYGACILGDDVLPAMNSASIEKKFSNDAFRKEVQSKMEEFKIAYSRYQQSLEDDTYKNIHKEGEGEDMDEKLKELIAKYSLTEDILKENGFNLEEYSTEESLEAKISEIAKEVETKYTSCEKCGQETCVCADSKIQSLESELENAKVQYEKLKADFDELVSQKEEVDSKYSKLSEEIEELRTFKSNKIKEERDQKEEALFAQFEDQLTEEEINSVKEKSSDMDLEQIEFTLYALVGKKNFQDKSNDKDKGGVKVGFQKSKEEDDGYGNILIKHLGN